MSVLAPTPARQHRFSILRVAAPMPPADAAPVNRIKAKEPARLQVREQMTLLDHDVRLDAPLAAYVSETSATSDPDEDTERFLEWLTREGMTLTGGDAGDVADWGVEAHFVRQRLQHARFQCLLQQQSKVQPSLKSRPDPQIHLNPVHLWVRIDHRRPDSFDESGAASMQLFFQVGQTVRSLPIPAMAEPLLRTLERGPLGLKSILKPLKSAGREMYETLISELAESGVIAIH